MLEQIILMTVKLLLNTHIKWMKFIKTLKIVIQIKNKMYWPLLILFLIWLVIKNINPIKTELFIRGRNLNISLVFTTQSNFAVPQVIRLNSKFQINKNFNKLHLIIHQILAVINLWIFTKNASQNHILF